MDASLLEVITPRSFNYVLTQKFSTLNSQVIISFLNFTGSKGTRVFLRTCSNIHTLNKQMHKIKSLIKISYECCLFWNDWRKSSCHSSLWSGNLLVARIFYEIPQWFPNLPTPLFTKHIFSKQLGVRKQTKGKAPCKDNGLVKPRWNGEGDVRETTYFLALFLHVIQILFNVSRELILWAVKNECLKH